MRIIMVIVIILSDDDDYDSDDNGHKDTLSRKNGDRGDDYND